MSIALRVTRGFGTGSLAGSPSGLVTRGLLGLAGAESYNPYQVTFDVWNGTTQFTHRFPRMFVAGVDPTSGDDMVNQNAASGSIWWNRVDKKLWICANPTNGAADWVQVYP